MHGINSLGKEQVEEFCSQDRQAILRFEENYKATHIGIDTWPTCNDK
jgi:hypothetical protein